jgi:hypothetical protein
MAEDAQRLVHPDLQHLQLDARDAGGVGELPRHRQLLPLGRASSTRSPALRPPVDGRRQPLLDGADAAPRARPLAARVGLFSFPSLSTDVVLAMLGVAIGRVLAREPVA